MLPTLWKRRTRLRSFLFLWFCGILAQTTLPAHAGPEYDIVVYGGTSAGVVAAVQADRLGKSVVLVAPEKHLGGLTASGLGFSDTGKKDTIGGLAREFYQGVWKHYDRPTAWRWQRRADYGNQGQGTPAIDGAQRTMWIFEPHVAEAVFEEMLQGDGVLVHREEWLDRERGVASKASARSAARPIAGESSLMPRTKAI